MSASAGGGRTAGAFYRAIPPAEARRLVHRLEFHYVPKAGQLV